MGFLPSARNLAKAWLLLLGSGAAVGALFWWASGYRAASLAVFCVLLAAAGLYWTLDRVAPGWSARVSSSRPRRRFCSRPSSGSRPAPAVARPKLYFLADGHPRAFAAGRGPRGSSLTVSAGLLSAASPAELDGILAHELVHIANRDVLVQTHGVRDRRLPDRGDAARRLVPARVPVRPRARSRRPSRTCCSRRTASSPPIAPRRRSASRRTAWPMGCSGSRRPARSSSSARARLPSRCTP